VCERLFALHLDVVSRVTIPVCLDVTLMLNLAHLPLGWSTTDTSVRGSVRAIEDHAGVGGGRSRWLIHWRWVCGYRDTDAAMVVILRGRVVDGGHWKPSSAHGPGLSRVDRHGLGFVTGFFCDGAWEEDLCGVHEYF
jgi:hypothetical protein